MKLGINCGHTKSGVGSGAVGILNESQETRNVGYALMNMLRNAGHTVVDCTIDKASSQNAYLSQAVNLANRQDLDYFISIHFNAGGGKGVEVYTYKGRQFADALEVCQNISALGFRNRGVKEGTGLYVIRKTKAKSMLIEVCFVDTQSDAELYRKVGANQIATAIYKAIVDTNVPSAPSTGAGAGTGANSGYTGGSIVDYLNSIGKDSSFSARKQYAQQYGIANYTGTASQNTQLLNLMRGGSTPTSQVSYYSSANSKSIVDGLKAIGVDSSFANRKKIAQANGISNYSGTASQNEQLCSLLRQGKLKKA